MPDRPRLLDLFSGAGGAARGYQMAGFHVTGIDHVAQPRYAGDVFIQADALEFVRAHGHEFDAIHASPPCQAYSSMRPLRWLKDIDYPELIPPTRDALQSIGCPWVIENVERAPLENGVKLCGTMFGLKVYRHRRFESDILLLQPPHPKHVVTIGSGHSLNARRRPNPDGWVSLVGHCYSFEAAKAAMGGVDWMTMAELSQAIPPAYTEFLGAQLLTVVLARRAA